MKRRFSARVLAQREREILEALLATFSARGCFATNLDGVTATVGIGKASLYQHFKSREELFRAALDYGTNELLARCQRIWHQDGDRRPHAKLLAVIAELVSLNHRHDPVSPATLLRLSCGNHWAAGGRSRQSIGAAFVPMVQQWQAAGVLDAAKDPSWIAAALLALVSSSPLLSIEHADESAETLARRVVTLLLCAFKPRHSARRMSSTSQP